MSDRPLLTVVVPNFEYARFFPRFFRALEAQTLDPAAMEVVLVDDGSTDGSAVEAMRWSRRLRAADFRFKAIRHRGLPGAVRNVGLSDARGRYMVCLDPDDVIAPTFLSRCLDALERTPGAALAYTDWSRVGCGESRDIACPEYAPGLLATQNYFPCTAMFRAEVWRASRGYAENTAYEDWDFWIQAEANGFAALRVPGALYEQRVHAGSYSARAVVDDGPAKAAIVLNNRPYFHPEVVAWARALQRGEPWAAPMPRGWIPRPEDVRAVRNEAARVLARRVAANRRGRGPVAAPSAVRP